MPLVTIILNSYNQREYLRQSVESALAQTLTDFELLIVDNGSNDGSHELLRSFTDPRIRLVLNENNVAISRRFNEAVAMARGEYICFLYSDDYYLPHKLERQVALFQALPSDYGVVYGPGYGFNQKTGARWIQPCIDFSGYIFEQMFTHFYRGFLNMIAPMAKRECFLRHRFYDDIFAEGEAIFFRLAMNYRFQYDSEPTAVWRDHGVNRGKAIKPNHDMTLKVLERLGQQPDFPAARQGDLRRLRAALNRDHGWEMLRLNGDAIWARGCLRQVPMMAPREALHPRYLAAVGLSLVPSSVRRALNRLGDVLRPTHESRNFVEDYS
jgi:glycosyltransferase involved in cell wall biosynthesis